MEKLQKGCESFKMLLPSHGNNKFVVSLEREKERKVREIKRNGKRKGREGET